METVRNLALEIENELSYGTVIDAVEGRDFRKITHIEAYRADKKRNKIRQFKNDASIALITFGFGVFAFSMVLIAMFM